jgi:hypothetical protein
VALIASCNAYEGIERRSSKVARSLQRRARVTLSNVKLKTIMIARKMFSPDHHFSSSGGAMVHLV